MKNKIISAAFILCMLCVIFATTSCFRSADGRDETDTGSGDTVTESDEITDNVTDIPDTAYQTESETSEQITTELPQTDAPPPSDGGGNSVISGGTVINNSDYDGYDNKLMGWGPGVSVNEKNQPAGSISYNKKYGSYSAVYMNEGEKNIYLTFDEGYENGYTEKILNTLRDKNAKAVFFLTYDYAVKNHDLVQRMVDEGHVLGNHSMKHKSMPSLSAAEAAEEIVGLHQYVKEQFGYEMNLFRPPMGEFSERTLAITRDLGYKSVFWSFAYMDWVTDKQPDPSFAIDKTTSSLHPGAIYLLHAVSSTNAQILGEFIDNARAAGYTITDFYH